MWIKKAAAIIAVGIAGAHAADAVAATCGESFQAVGDPRNGMRYAAERTIPGISMASALGQVRSMALSVGHEASGDVITPEDGTILLTQREGVAFPVITVVQVEPSGKIFVTVKLTRGQVIRDEDARTGLCTQLLEKIKAGAEGEAIAEAARVASRFDVPVAIDAQMLSGELGKEGKRLARSIGTAPLRGLFSGKSTGEADELTLQFAAKYLGRRYNVDGTVYTVGPYGFTGQVEVNYLVTQPKGLLGLRGSADFNGGNYGVKCVLAPDQRLLAGTLKGRDKVRLIGTVQDINAGGVILGDCRQAR